MEMFSKILIVFILFLKIINCLPLPNEKGFPGTIGDNNGNSESDLGILNVGVLCLNLIGRRCQKDTWYGIEQHYNKIYSFYYNLILNIFSKLITPKIDISLKYKYHILIIKVNGQNLNEKINAKCIIID